ncbi:MAG: hypothetical protein KH304_10690 [Clostridium sp.]|nr:hypothetical protein [Clostridium sp.]
MNVIRLIHMYILNLKKKLYTEDTLFEDLERNYSKYSAGYIKRHIRHM